MILQLHFISHREFFSSYTSGSFGYVRMGNDVRCKIVGMGDVWLETDIGCKLLLKDVRHVPDVRFHLISVGQLDDEGYHHSFGDKQWKLKKGSLVLAKGKKRNSLYFTEAKLVDGMANAVENENSTELWHKRLGHLSEKGLQTLARNQLLPKMTGTLLKHCTHCLAGKQHRVSFHTLPSSRKNHLLDLVHTDVCYMKDKTLGGAYYFVTFIDDHSRKVWAFALNSKDQVLEKFKTFHVMAERPRPQRKIKKVEFHTGTGVVELARRRMFGARSPSFILTTRLIEDGTKLFTLPTSLSLKLVPLIL